MIVTVQTTTVPHEPEADRVVFDHLGYEHDGYSHITLRFGFQDRPDVPAAPGPCGAFQKKRRVVNVRSRASARLTQPRSTPIG